MWWNRGKVSDLPWGRRKPFCRNSAGPGCAGARGWLESICVLCGLVLFIHCTVGVLGKFLIMFVSINHLVIGKRVLWATSAFRSVKNTCSGKAFSKWFWRKSISCTLLPEKKKSWITYLHVLHTETGFVFSAIHTCYFKLLSSESLAVRNYFLVVTKNTIFA